MLPNQMKNIMVLPWALFGVTVFSVLFVSVQSHSYHLGGCPTVEPMPEFDMSKFLGKWYVIQKTSTGSRCVLYNFTSSGEPGQFKVEQISEHPVLGLASVDNNYHYTGNLKVDSNDVPAKMTVRFPLSVAGSASYIVFMTDYSKYAGIFTCQKLAFANRRSATILSRTKTLDKIYVDKIRSRLSSSGVSPYDLSVIDQSNCPNDKDGVNINIDDETFSPHNIGGAVKKVGEKVGDGVEAGLNGAKKVYNAFGSSEAKDGKKVKTDDDKEDFIDPKYRYETNTEWLP